jgi:A/G-specific adenine glycosylase
VPRRRVLALKEAVLSWWATAKAERDWLPWRSTRDPWAVLVSEVMLAQTQAGRAASRFATLLSRFPEPASMARAPVGEVVALWNGLGYNRRAIWLHAAARRIVEQHAGTVPDRLNALMALSGVGTYTARAVLAFAFERPVAVVDTNVARVLARAVAGARLSAGHAQVWADRLLVVDQARAWNLALMDLGSLLCGPRPACDRCPLEQGLCVWRSAGSVLDPACGSAGTSRAQGRFVGSDRQGRGRLVRAAIEGPIAYAQLAEVAGWPEDPSRAERVAQGLLADGLLAKDDKGRLVLPG